MIGNPDWIRSRSSCFHSFIQHRLPKMIDLSRQKRFRDIPIAGAKAETLLLARAMAAKALMIVEKRNMFDLLVKYQQCNDVKTTNSNFICFSLQLTAEVWRTRDHTKWSYHTKEVSFKQPTTRAKNARSTPMIPRAGLATDRLLARRTSKTKTTTTTLQQQQNFMLHSTLKSTSCACRISQIHCIQSNDS